MQLFKSLVNFQEKVKEVTANHILSVFPSLKLTRSQRRKVEGGFAQNLGKEDKRSVGAVSHCFSLRLMGGSP